MARGCLIFKPLAEGRAKEIYRATGDALTEFCKNPRATVSDLKRVVSPERFEISSAFLRVDSFRALRKACVEDQKRRGWGDPTWPDEEVRHEREHINLVERADPRVRTELGFVHVSSTEESGFSLVNLPNLFDVYREDKEGLMGFLDQVVVGHSHPSEFDLLLAGRRR